MSKHDIFEISLLRITIFGHSAGAHIADALAYSPLAKGKFGNVQRKVNKKRFRTLPTSDCSIWSGD